MDRIRELLGRIAELSETELSELRDLILSQLGDDGGASEDVELSTLQELAEASSSVKSEIDRRAADVSKRAELAAQLKEFKSSTTPVAPAAEPPAPVETPPVPPAVEVVPEVVPAEPTPVVAATAPVVPDDRAPKPRVQGGATVVTAAADIPGWAMGSEFKTVDDISRAFTRRIDTMRGITGGDGDKIIVASARMDFPDDRTLIANDPEGNLAKIMAIASPQAITAAGGLGAFRETRYELFGGLGDTIRPVRDTLPVFRTDRGGVRFMRAPTLNDVNGVVGIWTVQNDIDARTNSGVRKPSFRVLPGPEIVVDTQAITMIMTFGNLMTRAYPELVRRHNELGLIAQARVAEQQLLTQIGALSTAVTGRTQALGAVKEFFITVLQAGASYRNRHRINATTPLRVIAPVWFRDLLTADFAVTGDDPNRVANAVASVTGALRAANINVTWAMDGEAGQDYTSMTAAGVGQGGSLGVAQFPSNVIWYLFAEGTFSFMDGGTLDLGLVRDSTLNAANDYQMFVETFENIVKFGHEAYRVTSFLKATGAWVGGITGSAGSTGYTG
jgi:hypothetical protein